MNAPRLLRMPVFWMGLVLAAAGWAYFPGLTGTFLFDDWKNLELIAQAGRLDNLHNLLDYLLSGFASPLGRPVAMASFLFDARSWPAPPFHFKATNVAIHLLNGLLLYRLLLALPEIAERDKSESWKPALLAAALWLLHPLWVSSVLYVVQRMTLLAATFVLLALLSYVKARHALAVGRPAMAGVLLWGVFGLVGIMGVLSKENAALLPLFVVVIDLALFNRGSPSVQPRWVHLWRWLYIRLPMMLLLIYLAGRIPELFSGQPLRDGYTAGGRFLTQGRVVVHYLSQLLIPATHSSGLFSDQISASKSLLQPLSTLWGWLAVLALAAWGWRQRDRRPLLALGILFFLAGHLLESTVVPLELAFEHRNYLPAIFLFAWPAGWLTMPGQPGRRWLAVFVVAVFALSTWSRANLWGKPFQQALVWYQEAPDSIRAQVLLAGRWLETGNREAAEKLLRNAVRQQKPNPAALISLARLQCNRNGIDADVKQKLSLLIAKVNSSPVRRYQVEQALALLASGRCRGLDDDAVLRWIDQGLRKAQGNKPWAVMLLSQRASMALRKHRPDAACRDYREVVRLIPREEAILKTSAILASHGALDCALKILSTKASHLDFWFIRSSRDLRRYWLEQSGYYRHEREVLRNQITEDMRRSPAGLPVESRTSTMPHLSR